MVIRLGIIGLSADKSAWATTTHAVPLKAQPLSDLYSITAVATSSPETAKAAAKAHGVPEAKAYSSPEDIAADKDVDMVVVSVKVPMHRQLTMPALRAKKDVFVEWPLGANLAEAEEMAALAKGQGVKNIVGLQTRQAPIILKAKEIISSGALGRILTTTLVASTSALANLPSKSSYLNDPKSGASLISIPVAHILDPLCFLLGEFASLSATTATNFPTLDFLHPDGSRSAPARRTFADSVSLTGTLRSGPTVTFTYTMTTPATPNHLSWIIAGEAAALRIESDGAAIQMSNPTLSISRPPSPDAPAAVWDPVPLTPATPFFFGGVAPVYDAFARGDPAGALVDFDAAVVRHRMVDAIVRSAESGARVSY